MTTDWHDDDSFWTTFWPFLFDATAWEQADAQVEQVLALVGVAPGARTLDLCCGPGRHSLALARRGLAVTGVDRTAAYLEQARSLSEQHGLALELVQADMREFARPASFNLIINLFTSFSYFADPADERRVLEQCYDNIAPGGALVIDIMGREVLAGRFTPRDWHDLGEGRYILEERAISADWTRVDARWLMFADGQATERRFSTHLYSASELGALLTGVGFDHVQAFGGLDGRPYDNNADRLVMVAR